MPNLTEGLSTIKELLEGVIIENGTTGKKSLITSSRLINTLHEVVKQELINEGVNPALINPPLGSSTPEVKLAGFLKFKTQDVCVFPNHVHPLREPLQFYGLHTGKTDPYGELFSEHILTINVRSQLSSLANNIDTMFERTYAEPLNLHRRVPKMVLGEVYLLAARELDNRAVAEKRVAYAPITNTITNAIETYINGFTALNDRQNQRDDDFKYERVALIIADFSQNPIKIYNSSAELIADGLLPANSNAMLENLTFTTFVSDLLQIYERRFGTGKLS